MKLDNKKIIIIAAVAALAFIAYRRWKKLSGEVVDVSDTVTGGQQTLSFNKAAYDSLINTHLTGFSSADKLKVKRMCYHIFTAAARKENWDADLIKASADGNGITYDQQVFLNAIYQVFVYQKEIEASNGKITADDLARWKEAFHNISDRVVGIA